VSSAQLEPNSYLALSTPVTSYLCSAPVTIAAASSARAFFVPCFLCMEERTTCRRALCPAFPYVLHSKMRMTIAASRGRIAVNAVGLPPLGESLPGRAAAAFAGVSTVRRTAWRGVA
jgi:hypothetical protein